MADVFLGLGSNQDAPAMLASALKALAEQFGTIEKSPVYESEAVGFNGTNFLNMVVRVQTSLTVGELLANLRAIEDNHGRDRSQPKFASRTLDIDILTYDRCVGEFDGVTLPRDEVLKNAFVLRPLADSWPEIIHPETHQCYAALWQRYDQSSQKLWRADCQF